MLFSRLHSLLLEASEPSLNELIERFRQEVWNNAKYISPEEVEGLCTAYAHEFAEWLHKHGIPAEVVYFQNAKEAGYENRSRIPQPDEGHAVVKTMGMYVDWTAAQYGFKEFPLIRPVK